MLLEKGEQEYLALLEILQNDPQGCERQRTTDLWTQLLAEAERARGNESSLPVGQIGVEIPLARAWREGLAHL